MIWGGYSDRATCLQNFERVGAPALRLLSPVGATYHRYIWSISIAFEQVDNCSVRSLGTRIVVE